MNAIIKKPIISEKSMIQASLGQYTFLVDREATKVDIRKAIERKFEVNVISVKTINMKAKIKMQRSRKGRFTVPAAKKAMVGLKKGQKITLFENATPTEEVEVRTAEGEKIAEVSEKKSFLRGTKVKIEKVSEQKQKIDKVNSKKRAGTAEAQKESK